MNLFKKLTELLNNDLDSYDHKIKEIEKEIDKNKEILKIINLVNNNDEIYLSQVKEIAYYYPELSDYIMILQEIGSIYKLIDNNHYDRVLPDRIRIVLSNAGITSNDIIKVLDDFTMCDKLKNYVRTDEADKYTLETVNKAKDNIMNKLTKAFNEVFSNLINEIQERYHVLGNIKILQSEKDRLGKDYHDLAQLKDFFNENGIVGKIDNNNLNIFYKWLEVVKFSNKIEVIKTIINEQIKNKDKTTEEIIDENRDKVISNLDKTLDFKKNMFDIIDISTFTEEELQIFLAIKKIYINKCSQYSERVLFTDIELKNRKESYFNHHNIEWEIVLGDIENNLLPEINNKHDYVFQIFKYIIEINNKEQQYKEYLVKLSEKEKILNKYIDILNNLANIDNLYDTTCDYLFQNNVSKDDLRYNDKYEYYSIRYFIRNTINAFIMDLENEKDIITRIIQGDRNYNDTWSLEDINNQYNNILKEYHNKWNEYGEYQKKQYDIDEETVDYEEKENLVFCLDNLSFNDSFDNYDEGRKKEFDFAIKSLESRSYENLKKALGRKGINEILYHSASKNKSRKGKTNTSYSSFGSIYFTPFRYSGTANYRTGFIMFPLCKENKNKLQKIYNLGDNCAIFGIFKIISAVRANHDEYHDFSDYIRKNEDYLEKIGELFLNPNTDIQLLCTIIDKGLEIKDNLQKQGVAK